MAGPNWAVFAGVVALVTAAVLVLARHSTSAADEGLPPRVLVVNTALSQGLLGGLLALTAWYAQLPAAALGLGAGAAGLGALGVGAAAGLALYAADEVAAAGLRQVGVEVPERLRELLAPATPLGWVLLLGVALPVVAGFEELLFRAALVGALGAATGLSPPVLVVASSLLFGAAHGAQGVAGMAVATALGAALGVLFVATGSLPAVVTAHYVVNATEFLRHER